MKPTLQQEEILKTYLSNILKYKETIDEVYDHVLIAVEHKPENDRFQDAVNQVLNNDFGGGKSLVKTEEQRLRDATWEGFIQIVKYIKSDFELSNIFYTILLFSASYYVAKQLNISSFSFIIAYPVGLFIYSSLIWTRKFFVEYHTKDTRKSIQDVIIAKLAYPSFYLLFIWMMFLPVKPKLYHFILIDHPEIFALFMTLYFLYISALIKICRDEFKPYFAN